MDRDANGLLSLFPSEIKRAKDIKVLMLYMTDSPVRTIVQDVSEETFELTLHGPEGPAYALSHSGSPAGREAAKAGNLAVVPPNLDPAIGKQILQLNVYTPTRNVQRCICVFVGVGEGGRGGWEMVRRHLCMCPIYCQSFYTSMLLLCVCRGSTRAGAGPGLLQLGALDKGVGQAVVVCLFPCCLFMYLLLFRWDLNGPFSAHMKIT
jgi:hypothetical protein